MTGLAIGRHVNEFNDMKDLEVMTFRRNILNVCRQAVEERDKNGPHSQALYAYPPDIESRADLPTHLKEKVVNGTVKHHL